MAQSAAATQAPATKIDADRSFGEGAAAAVGTGWIVLLVVGPVRAQIGFFSDLAISESGC